MRAADFLFGQPDEAVQVKFVTPPKQFVLQHRAERRRERKRQPRVNAVAPPVFQKLDERDVGFGDGLEKPAFFQKLFMFRMAHERQVCVQDE